MKTIFVTIGESMTARNIFRTPFWGALLRNNPGERFVLLVPQEKKDYYAKEFGAPNVVVEGFDPEFRGRFAGVLTSLMRSSIASHTNLWSKMRSYQRGDSGLLVTIFKRVYTSTLGRISRWKIFLRWLLLFVPPNEGTRELYARYRPQLLFAPSLTQYDFDVPIAVEAKRRGTRIVGMVRSWDNFSSHGLLRVVPDLFILQNMFLREMAERYQALNEKRVPMKVIGVPHYDTYLDIEPILESRENFFRRMGLDPKKKLILYGAMGDFLFPREGSMADVFEELVAAGKIKEPAQVLFRAHPKFQSPLERIKTLRHVKPDRGATYLSGEMKSMEMEDKDTRHLINSIYHSDAIVSGASTIALDAVLLNKPTVVAAFDGKTKNVSYWDSVRRFYDCYTHFEAFMEASRVPRADTKEELAEYINAAFIQKVYDSTRRQKVIELFAAPRDGKASERLEKIISEEVQRLA